MTDLDDLRARAMVSGALQHCWDEFRDTLHPQKTVTAQGELLVSRWRSTALASMFFTEQSLVHSPLRTEFFKHLPGILTGVGIIGTFGGLILGLQTFGGVNLSDPEETRLGLSALLREVGSAFMMSGAAIALAMVLTTIEKILLNGLITRVESLCSQIDTFFDAGAGEEYLQRLVEAAETSATQALQMKESLVTDLRQVLTELADRQIAATHVATGQLGQSITESLDEGLKGPLKSISDAVSAVGTNQGDAVNKLLTDVLASFSSQMEGMFGRQLSGMGEMLSRTADTMQTASSGIEALLGQIQQAGNGAADALAGRMEEVLTAMQARQEESARQMQAFMEAMGQRAVEGQRETGLAAQQMVEQLTRTSAELVRQLQATGQGAADAMAERVTQALAQIQTGQEESAAQVKAFVEEMKSVASQGQREATLASAEMIKGLGDVTTEILERLKERSDDDARMHGERQQQLSEGTTSLLAKQSEQVSGLIASVGRSEAAMRETINLIQKATTDQLAQMQAGASKLHQASELLGSNLTTMKASSDNLVGSADGLTKASATLGGTVRDFQKTLDDHKTVRDTLAAMVADLKLTVDNAKRDATVTRELVSGIQQAATRLTDAQQATVANLEEATESIADAHGAFATAVENTLREGNRVFHEELASATGMLKSAIQDLGDVLDSMPNRHA